MSDLSSRGSESTIPWRTAEDLSDSNGAGEVAPPSGRGSFIEMRRFSLADYDGNLFAQGGGESDVSVPPGAAFKDFQKIAKATSTKIASSLGVNASYHKGGAKALCDAIEHHYSKDVADTVVRRLSIDATEAKPLGSYKISKAIKLAEKFSKIEELNKNLAWVSGGNFSVDSAGENFDVPQTNLHPASLSPALKDAYESDGIQGVCSKDAANPKHAINLWRDRFVVGSKELFSCVRSGLLAAMKLPKEQREKTFNTRLHENIAMVLEGNRDAIEAKLKAGSEKSADLPGSKNNPIAIDLLDIGLLSNYNFCGFGSENKMKQEQFRLLDQANGELRQISYTDTKGKTQSLWVKPSILALNIGMQRGDALFASVEDMSRTEEVTATICKRAAAYLAGVTDPLERATITQLQDQCQELVKNKVYLQENGGDYYALPARLALLAHKIGIKPPMIHCKSGKDRTARLIEEVKFLALRIEENAKKKVDPAIPPLGNGSEKDRLLPQGSNAFAGLVPPSGTLSDMEKSLLIDVAMHSGNQKIQELNTGVVGNKQGWQFGKRLGVYGLVRFSADLDLQANYLKYKGGSDRVAA